MGSNRGGIFWVEWPTSSELGAPFGPFSPLLTEPALNCPFWRSRGTPPTLVISILYLIVDSFSELPM